MEYQEYRVQPVQVEIHGLKDLDAKDILTEPKGFELFKRDGIKLISMGIFPDEEHAKNIARQHAGDNEARFV